MWIPNWGWNESDQWWEILFDIVLDEDTYTILCINLHFTSWPSDEKTPSEMEEAPRYTLSTLSTLFQSFPLSTLFQLFTLLPLLTLTLLNMTYTNQTLLKNYHIYAYMYSFSECCCWLQALFYRLYCWVTGWGGYPLDCCDFQSRRKCVIVASALRAEQGPCEPIKGCICEIREQ